jgi:hypothetical protein
VDEMSCTIDSSFIYDMDIMGCLERSDVSSRIVDGEAQSYLVPARSKDAEFFRVVGVDAPQDV